METTNLSKIRRDKMLNTIDEIKKNITDEKILTNLSMIENELTKKKYGLIWEEHEERVDKELETQIPTFEEIKDKEIVKVKESQNMWVNVQGYEHEEQNVINKIMPFFTQYYSVKWENYPVHDHYVSNPIRIDVKR